MKTIIDKDQFAKDNYGLINKFLSVYHINNIKDEVLDVLYIGYTDALNTYDSDRGAFSTYAFIRMENAYFHWLSTNKRPKRDAGSSVLSLDAYLTDDDSLTLLDIIPDESVDIENQIYNKILLESVDLVAKKILKEREYIIYTKHFRQGLRGTQIAKEYGISKQAIDVIKLKAIRKLIKYFKKHPLDFKVPKEEKKEYIDDLLYDIFVDKNIEKEKEKSVEELLYDMVGEK